MHGSSMEHELAWDSLTQMEHWRSIVANIACCDHDSTCTFNSIPNHLHLNWMMIGFPYYQRFNNDIRCHEIWSYFVHCLATSAKIYRLLQIEKPFKKQLVIMRQYLLYRAALTNKSFHSITNQGIEQSRNLLKGCALTWNVETPDGPDAN